MTTPKPTKADVAAADEWLRGPSWSPATLSNIISRHMQPERELLIELAESQGDLALLIILAAKARAWKKGQGL